jgi:hypothetical protein
VKAVVVDDAVLHEPQAGGDEVGQNHVHYTTHRSPIHCGAI